MTDEPTPRAAALTGLALAAAVATWWLPSVRLALDQGADAGRSAVDALQALLVVRALALGTLGVRGGALHGWRPGAAAGLGLIVPSWPVVALAWSASEASLARVALAEFALLAAAAVLPLLGQGLRRGLRRAEPALVAGTALGIALAASAWAARSLWRLSLP